MIHKQKYILPMLILMMSTSPISVMAKTYTTDVVNGISTGDIHISINEYEHDTNGNLVSYVDNKMVLPGQTVDKIIRITNDANQAWIRAKVEYTDCGEQAGLSDDDIVLSSDKWKKCGAYYYYTEPVDSKAYVDFVKAVRVPSSWDSSKAGNDFSIYTSVDAVQTANFTPDFSVNDPWFGTVIEECIHTAHDTNLNTSNEPFSIVFENGADGIVKTGDDFFKNWAALMPGDTVSDEVNISNRYERTVDVFFTAEALENKNLLSKLHMVIKHGDKILFSGTMDKAIDQDISLGSYGKNESSTITYTVSVPKELNNQYALAKAKTAWHFKCVLKESSNHNSGNSGSSGSSGSSGGSGMTSVVEGSHSIKFPTTTETNASPNPYPAQEETSIQETRPEPQISETVEQRKNPKTGDDSQLMFYLSSMGFFGCVAALMIIFSKKKKKKGTKESGS